MGFAQEAVMRLVRLTAPGGLENLKLSEDEPVIDRCFPLHEIVAAFEYFESQKHFGKVGLEL